MLCEVLWALRLCKPQAENLNFTN